MFDFTRTDPFEEEPIETQRQRLTRIDREALLRFYRSFLHDDLLAQERQPRAPYLRHLLRGWKETAEREQATEARALLSTMSFFMTGDLVGKSVMANPVDTLARHA